MKKRNLVITIIIAVAVLIWFLTTSKKAASLKAPGFASQNTQTSSPAPLATPQAPKTFQFDTSTDLKAELEKINPQILDSDFE